MHDLPWAELGVGGIFALLTLRLVFEFLTKWKGRNGRSSEVRRETEQACEVRRVHENILGSQERIEHKLDEILKNLR